MILITVNCTITCSVSQTENLGDILDFCFMYSVSNPLVQPTGSPFRTDSDSSRVLLPLSGNLWTQPPHVPHSPPSWAPQRTRFSCLHTAATVMLLKCNVIHLLQIHSGSLFTQSTIPGPCAVLHDLRHLAPLPLQTLPCPQHVLCWSHTACLASSYLKTFTPATSSAPNDQNFLRYTQGSISHFFSGFAQMPPFQERLSLVPLPKYILLVSPLLFISWVDSTVERVRGIFNDLVSIVQTVIYFHALGNFQEVAPCDNMHFAFSSQGLVSLSAQICF